MKEIDTKNIIKKTKALVAYQNFEKEEQMKKIKIKHFTYALIAMSVLLGGTFTVDAMTDNSISNAIKNVFPIKVNDQEQNAKCEKTSNGKIKCVLDKEVLGTSEEYSFETDEENLNNMKAEVKDNEFTIIIDKVIE